MPLTREPPLSSRVRRIGPRPQPRRARPGDEHRRANAGHHQTQLERRGRAEQAEANQPAATPTTPSRAMPNRPKRSSQTRVSRCCSRPCCAAANGHRGGGATGRWRRTRRHRLGQPGTGQRGDQGTDHRTADSAGDRSRRDGTPSSFAREIGASSSQKPSAAEASTGPNSRLTASASRHRRRANAAQGSTVRADRQESVVHSETTRCALRTTLRPWHRRSSARRSRRRRRRRTPPQVAGGPPLAPVPDQTFSSAADGTARWTGSSGPSKPAS